MVSNHTPARIFCSYADGDAELYQQLKNHLATLIEQGIIALWDRHDIIAGTYTQQEIKKGLATSPIILLLLSAEFFSSQDCISEMEYAKEQQIKGKAHIILILLRWMYDWQSSFQDMEPQVLPDNTQPLKDWSDRDQAFVNIAAGIHRAVDNLNGHETTTQTDTSGLTQLSISNVPYPPSHFFVGRESELRYLHEQLHTKTIAAIGQVQAINGLGGVGKTRLAIEYTHRYRGEYKAIFWALADTQETLNNSYIEIANLLNLPGDVLKHAQAVRQWLQTQRDYLLILDNADDLDLIHPFFPSPHGGHILLTTRTSALRSFNIANPLSLDTFTAEQGAVLLFRGSNRFKEATAEDQHQGRLISEELGGLPLALEQVAAYLDATGINPASYLQMYQQYRTQLLRDRRYQPRTYHDNRDNVATTWEISFERVEQKNSIAANVLYFCAFLAPDTIPETLLTTGAKVNNVVLPAVASNVYELNQAIGDLRAYSLIERHDHTLTLHRLVQAILRDRLTTDQQRDWAQQVIAVMDAIIPSPPINNWQQWLPYVPHINACVQHIGTYKLVSEQSGNLLEKAGTMLRYYGRTKEEEQVYRLALSIYEQVLGPDDPNVVKTLGDLARVLSYQKDYQQALQLQKRALSICERTLGPDHPDTLTSLESLALFYSYWHHFDESQQIYEQALQIRERTQGQEHQDTATTLVNIANLYRVWGDIVQRKGQYDQAQNKYEQAKLLLERALHIQEQAFGQETTKTISTLNALAGIYRRLHLYAQAETLFQHIMIFREKTFGATHLSTAAAISNLAFLYSEWGNHERALHLYEQALRIREQEFGAEHPYTTITHFDLGQQYYRMGDYQKAEELLQRALTSHERYWGIDHPKNKKMLEVYAQLLHKLGRDEEAGQLDARARKIGGEDEE